MDFERSKGEGWLMLCFNDQLTLAFERTIDWETVSVCCRANEAKSTLENAEMDQKATATSDEDNGAWYEDRD